MKTSSHKPSHFLNVSVLHRAVARIDLARSILLKRELLPLDSQLVHTLLADCFHASPAFLDQIATDKQIQ